MIVDMLGNEIVYWPISGLAEGATSDHLLIRLLGVVAGDKLEASYDPKVKIWARYIPLFGSPTAYQDISVTPFALGAEDPKFEIYVEALSPVVGLYRVSSSISKVSSSFAGWQA